MRDTGTGFGQVLKKKCSVNVFSYKIRIFVIATRAAKNKNREGKLCIFFFFYTFIIILFFLHILLRAFTNIVRWRQLLLHPPSPPNSTNPNSTSPSPPVSFESVKKIFENVNVHLVAKVTKFLDSIRNQQIVILFHCFELTLQPNIIDKKRNTHFRGIVVL